MNSLVAYDSSDSESENDKSEEIKYTRDEENFAHSNFELRSVFPTTSRMETSGCGHQVKMASTGSNVDCSLNSTQNFAQRHFGVTSRPAVMTLNDESCFQVSKGVHENSLALVQKSGRTGKMIPSAQKRLLQDSMTGTQNIKPYVPKRLREKEAACNKSNKLQESRDIFNTGIDCTAPAEYQLGLLSKVSDFIKPYLESQHKTSKVPKHLVFQMSQHSGPVTTIQWCPVEQHSHLLLSASMDKSIKNCLCAHSMTFCRIYLDTWHPLLRTSSCYKKIWDAIETGRCLKTYFGHSGAIRDAQWSLCGRQVLSGGFDSMLHLTDIETDMFETKMRPPLCSLAGGQFPHSRSFRILLSAGTTLLEQGEEAGYLGAGQDLFAGDSANPLDVQDASQAAKVEGIETPLLSGVEAPGLAAVKQCAEDAGPVDCNPGVRRQLSVLPDSLCQPGEC
ncbi:uncharacterized protein wdr25 isoform X3 [Mobula birostris]|uniref:uncharacterized protein wdr25 isoform X3 n=1 Tax=Mobula birostris TaxID=1983395 RepID=UPI003B28AC0E